MTINIAELRESIAAFGSQAINEDDLNELLTRLESEEEANREWAKKTYWVQEEVQKGDLPLNYLGWHRADILRAEVLALRAQVVRLKSSLKGVEKERDNANAAAAGVALQAIELESKLEVAEKTNRGWLRANATGGWIDNLRIENDTLRAKIDQLEEDTRAALTSNSVAQPTSSVPDGWLRAIDEALVTAHIGVANAHDTYEQAKPKLDNLIGFHVGVATDPAVNGGWKLMPVEPTQEMINHVIDERLDALVAGKEHTFIDIYTAMIAAANPGAQTKGEEK